jgi:hypothetical protein
MCGDVKNYHGFSELALRVVRLGRQMAIRYDLRKFDLGAGSQSWDGAANTALRYDHYWHGDGSLYG